MDKKRAILQFNNIKKKAKNIRLAADGWNKDWKTLISTIMSARTTDKKTIPVAGELFKKYKSVKALANAKISEVAKVIKPVNFYKTKSKNVVGCAKMLVSDYNGKVPRDFEDLVKLPGVGRKTANVFLAVQGYGEIGVDTHVAYISKKMGWTNSDKQKNIEEDLKKIFPKRMWGKINWVLVRFGQTYTSRREKNKILDEIRGNYE